jgi:hypothetical protein
MRYLLAVVVGAFASAISLMILAAVMAVRYRGLGVSEVGINISAPLPLTIAIAAFIAGVYFVLRISN